MSGPLLEARGLEKSFGANRVLRGVDVAVPSGSVTCLIGPSGSGKTTVLRSLNGLETPEAGTVRIGDVELDWAIRPDARAMARLRGQSGMVFQAHNLFPHLTVLDNVTSGPVFAQGRPRAEAQEEAREPREAKEAKEAKAPTPASRSLALLMLLGGCATLGGVMKSAWFTDSEGNIMCLDEAPAET